jgi:hypothetical protein
MKKVLVLALALSASVFMSAITGEAKLAANGAINGLHLNGISAPITGLDFTTISHQGLGK